MAIPSHFAKIPRQKRQNRIVRAKRTCWTWQISTLPGALRAWIYGMAVVSGQQETRQYWSTRTIFFQCRLASGAIQTLCTSCSVDLLKKSAFLPCSQDVLLCPYPIIVGSLLASHCLVPRQSVEASGPSKHVGRRTNSLKYIGFYIQNK
jgi:hypothetical protein